MGSKRGGSEHSGSSVGPGIITWEGGTGMPSLADGCHRTPNLLVPQVSSPSHIRSVCTRFPARTQKSLQDFAVPGACFGPCTCILLLPPTTSGGYYRLSPFHKQQPAALGGEMYSSARLLSPSWHAGQRSGSWRPDEAALGWSYAARNEPPEAPGPWWMGLVATSRV